MTILSRWGAQVMVLLACGMLGQVIVSPNSGMDQAYHGNSTHQKSIVHIFSQFLDLPQLSISSTAVSAIRAASPHYYHIRNDGWVFDGLRRVCLIPLDCRVVQNLQASHGNKLAIFTAKADVVILDFSRVSNFGE